MSLSLLATVAIPFAGAAVLWAFTRLLKFKEASYARCFVSVAIGLAGLAAAWLLMLPIIPSLLESRRTVWVPVAVSLTTGLIGSAIATPLLFRESVAKSLAALGLSLGSVLLLAYLLSLCCL